LNASVLSALRTWTFFMLPYVAFSGALELGKKSLGHD